MDWIMEKENALTCTCIATIVGSFVAVKFSRRIRCLERELKRTIEQRDSEHNGRIAMQNEMRAIAASKLQNEDALFYAPIGTIKSCFTRCVGTPRQGHLAPKTRATLQLNRNSICPSSVDGLEHFSHVWVFFVFHLNNNPRWIKGFTDGKSGKFNGTMFPAKVTPPFLKKKVGLFATRSPHRPNNIGVSLCRLERIDQSKVTLHLRGIDLVDGTPVLDIKPFVPSYDAISPASVAPWVEDSLVHRRKVTWMPEAKSQLEQFSSELDLYKGDVEDAYLAITQTLEVDVRSKFMTNKAEGNVKGGMIKGLSTLGTMCFDTLHVQWKTHGEFNAVIVESVMLAASALIDNTEESIQDSN